MAGSSWPIHPRWLQYRIIFRENCAVGKLRWLSSLPFFFAMSAIVAFLLINYFFCPRFVLWQGLGIPDAWFNPEVNRAVFALKQIQHPFEPINNVSNEVIRWRLLFPLIAHYLSIPNFIYLMLPHLGCIVVLVWIAKTAFDKARSAAFGNA